MLNSTTRLKKELGFFSVYALATGATLSAGFFLLPGIAATKAGPTIVLAYVLAAIPLLPATLSIIELATAMPRAGGAYYFVDRSLGPVMGTIGGIGTWIALMLKTAFALVGMGAYLSLFFDHVPIIPLAVALAVAFGILNVAGAKGVGKFQLVLVAGLLVILALFLTGMTQVNWSNFEGFSELVMTDWENVISTAGLVCISYVGVTNVASVSEEIKDPERNLPRAVLLSTLTAVVIYALGTMVMIGVLGAATLGDESAGKIYYAPVANTVSVLFGPWGKIAVSVAAVLAFFSVANAGILSSSRYPLAMSRDHLMPPMFSRLSKHGIPYLGIILSTAIIVCLLLFLPVKEIAKLASAFQLLMFALLCLAVIAMRESGLDSYDPSFRSPFYPWMQIFGILLPLVFIFKMGWTPIIFSTGMVIAASVWYFRYGASRVQREGAIFHVFRRLGERYHEPLDTELRGIMIEKGLREQDPFDAIVARAHFIDLAAAPSYETATERASDEFAKLIPDSAEHIQDGFKRLTSLGATAICQGGAIPHLRVKHLEHPEMVLVRCIEEVPIGHLDDFGEQHELEDPVHAIFFLISPEDNPGQHLRILAHIAGHLENKEFMPQWLAAKNEQEIKESLLRNERFVSVTIDSASASSTFLDKQVLELGLPLGTLVAIVRRGAHTIVPRGHTTLREGDVLTIIGEPSEIASLYETYCT